MAKKRKAPSLQALLSETADDAVTTPKARSKPIATMPTTQQQSNLPKTAPTNQSPPKKAGRKPSRYAGCETTTMSVKLPVKVKEELEKLWFAERHMHTQNDLVLEGIDRVFKNRGLPSLNELLKN